MAETLVVAKKTKIESLTVDAVLTETHTFSNTVTDHPVEEGMNISDHVRKNPDGLVLECFISNTPLGSTGASRQVEQNGVKWNTKVPSASENAKRRGEAFDKLKKLMDDGTLCKVVTNLRTYTNMELVDLTLPVTTKSFHGLQFTATFKLVRIVETSSARGSAKAPQTSGKKNGGSKPLAPVDDTAPLKKIAKVGQGSDSPTIKGFSDTVLSHNGEGLQSH